MHKLYDMYEEWLKEKNMSDMLVTRHFYRDVFSTEFNIGCEPPNSDTCNLCDKTDIEIKSLVDDQDSDRIKVLKTDKLVHTNRAKER